MGGAEIQSMLAAVAAMGVIAPLRLLRRRRFMPFQELLFEGAPQPLLIIDEAGIILGANGAAQALLGLTRKQLLSRAVTELLFLSGTIGKPGGKGGEEERHLQGRARRREGHDELMVELHLRATEIEGRPVWLSTLKRTISAPPRLPWEEVSPQSIFELLRSPAILLDGAGRIVRFNEACRRLGGCPFDQLVGHDIAELLLPREGWEAVPEVRRRSIESGGSWEVESAWVTESGERRLLAWSVEGVRDEQGAVCALFASAVDVTHRRGVEEQLRRARDEFEKRVMFRTAALRVTNDALVESEARLAEAQRIAHVGNWEWIVAGDVFYWSEEGYRIFGVLPRLFKSTFASFLEMVHPEDREEVRAAMLGALESGGHLGLDHRIVRPDGTLRHVHQEAVITRNEEGRAARITGTVQDITERKQAEEALRAAHTELEHRVAERTAELRLANRALGFTQFAVDHAVNPILWLSSDLRFVYANAAAHGALGYPPDALLGHPFQAIDQGVCVDPRACETHWEEARREGRAIFESLLVRKDGQFFPVEIAANHVRYDGQEYFCLFARDLTETRRAEAAVRDQLAAARLLADLSARFVREPLDVAMRGALVDITELLPATCFCLFNITEEGPVPADLQARNQCEMPAGCAFRRAAEELLAQWAEALRAGRVVAAQDPLTEGQLLLVPISDEQGMVGVIGFGGVPDARRWAEDGYPVLRTAARVIAAAIQRRRAEERTETLLDENRRLARQSMEIQERERAHLARELHDELGQCLTAIRADAASICAQSRDRYPRIYESGQAISQVASRVYEVVRSIMRRLRPELLDDLGLAEAVRDVVVNWQGRHPEITWNLDLQGELGELPEPVRITAYRVVQEALTNVAKHANASRVDVKLQMLESAGRKVLEVRVADNGRNPAVQAQRQGMGLLGMRERVLATGGDFSVNALPGEGFTIHARFPLSGESNSDREETYQRIAGG